MCFLGSFNPFSPTGLGDIGGGVTGGGDLGGGDIDCCCCGSCWLGQLSLTLTFDTCDGGCVGTLCSGVSSVPDGGGCSLGIWPVT